MKSSAFSVLFHRNAQHKLSAVNIRRCLWYTENFPRSQVRTAKYLNGSGTNALWFRYRVRATDRATSLDYTNVTALSTNR